MLVYHRQNLNFSPRCWYIASIYQHIGEIHAQNGFQNWRESPIYQHLGEIFKRFLAPVETTRKSLLFNPKNFPEMLVYRPPEFPRDVGISEAYTNISGKFFQRRI